MSFQVEVDPNAAEALNEAQSGGNGKFPPGPKGEYQATVVPLKDTARVEVVDFGGTGANSKKKVVRIAVRVLDNSPTLGKRQFFLRVPLFTRYAPNEKNPQGAPARLYFDFWSAVGVSEADLVAGKLPEPDAIMGKPIGIVISEAIEPDKWNPLGSNEVQFVNKAGNYAGTPIRVPGTPVAPWLDADDNLIPTYPFQSPEAQAMAAQILGQTPPPIQGSAPAAPPTSWGAAPVAGQTGPAQPTTSWGATPAVQAQPAAQAPATGGQVVAGPWGQQQVTQPAAEQPTGLQAAAQQAVSY